MDTLNIKWSILNQAHCMLSTDVIFLFLDLIPSKLEKYKEKLTKTSPWLSPIVSVVQQMQVEFLELQKIKKWNFIKLT